MCDTMEKMVERAIAAKIVCRILRGQPVWLCEEDVAEMRSSDFLRYWADLREALDANGA
jgi:hypothetical protein